MSYFHTSYIQSLNSRALRYLYLHEWIQYKQMHQIMYFTIFARFDDTSEVVELIFFSACLCKTNLLTPQCMISKYLYRICVLFCVFADSIELPEQPFKCRPLINPSGSDTYHYEATTRTHAHTHTHTHTQARTHTHSHKFNMTKVYCGHC